MVSSNEVAKRIAALTSELGLSQRGLAKKSGLSQSTLSRAMSGEREFHVDELLDIATALDVPLAELVDASPVDDDFSFAARTHDSDPSTEAVRNRLLTLLRIRQALDDLD